MKLGSVSVRFLLGDTSSAHRLQSRCDNKATYGVVTTGILQGVMFFCLLFIALLYSVLNDIDLVVYEDAPLVFSGQDWSITDFPAYSDTSYSDTI